MAVESARYGNFVDALCFRGVWGLAAIAASYVAAAVLTLFIVILMYLVVLGRAYALDCEPFTDFYR